MYNHVLRTNTHGGHSVADFSFTLIIAYNFVYLQHEGYKEHYRTFINA